MYDRYTLTLNHSFFYALSCVEHEKDIDSLVGEQILKLKLRALLYE